MSANRFDVFGAAFRRIRIWRLRLLTILILPVCVLNTSLCGCAKKTAEPVLETWQNEAENQSVDDSAGATSKNAEPETDGPEANGSKAAGSEGNGPKTAGSKTAGSKENGSKPAGSENDGPEATGPEAADSITHESAMPAPELRTLTVHVCGAVRREGVYTLPEGSRIHDAIEAAGGFSKDADTAYLNLATEIQDAWQIRVPTREEADALRSGIPLSAVYGAGAAADDPGEDGSRTGAGTGTGTGYGAGTGTGTGTEFGTASSGGKGTAENNPGPDTGENGSGKENGKINLNSATREELMQLPGIGETKAQRILEYREKNGRFEEIEDLMKVPGIKDASFQKLKDHISI